MYASASKIPEHGSAVVFTNNITRCKTAQLSVCIRHKLHTRTYIYVYSYENTHSKVCMHEDVNEGQKETNGGGYEEADIRYLRTVLIRSYPVGRVDVYARLYNVICVQQW